MTAFVCSTLRGVAARRCASPIWRTPAAKCADAFDLATLGSMSTVAVALASAVALAVLGGA
jgi:hypothetical protein